MFMQQLKFALLALCALACTALPAQGQSPADVLGTTAAPAKGNVALGIRLGSASTRYLGQRPDGTYANKWGLTPVAGLDLRFNRPNNTSHILGIDFYPENAIIRNANGTIIGGNSGILSSYEFRKYHDLGSGPLRAYYGAWVQGGGAGSSSTGTGTNVVAELNLGVSGGLQYDFSKRFFLEGGLRVGLASASFKRDGIWGNRFELGTGRNLLQAHIGFGIRL